MKKNKFNIVKSQSTVSMFLAFLAILIVYHIVFSSSSLLAAQKNNNNRSKVIQHDKTNFPLEGKHRTADCSECHLKGVMQGTPSQCEVCHWQRKQDDRYRLQLGLHCGDCHTSFDWKVLKPNSWEHHRVTGYELQGIHKTLDCFQCHKTNTFVAQPNDCWDCHQKDYRDANDPNHVSGNFPTDCKVCHTSMISWEPATFSHVVFPLRGSHLTTDCKSCHINGLYSGTASQCSDCHTDDYNKTDNPNHQQAGYSFDCVGCHGSEALTWSGAVVDHTSFLLKGNHQTAACTDCHINGQYTGTPRDCSGCHLDDYNKTTNPNHQQAGYSNDCESCHGPEALTWTGAVADHSSFPLKGNHKTTACTDCHTNGQYAGTSRDCSGCHMNDYNNTTNPNHQQAAYSNDCENCHESDALTWTGAVVDHSSFPLNGNHKTANCADCHINGQYAGTSRDCSGCHMDDYNQTTDPNHQQAAYSNDCESCHGSDALTWTGAVVSHTTFPLKGNHKTAACTDCHIGGKYSGTSQQCISCHQDDYNSVQDPNHQLAGFSTDCIPCHGTEAITWSNATFNHDQFWRLEGPHRTLDCNTCHQAGYDLPTNCFGCHKQDYDNTTDPNHQSAGFPTTCDSCHFKSHITWNQAVFNHQFPINSGNHNGISCNECHLTANYAQFSCIDCHEHNKNDTDNDHNDVGGYQYNSQACYSCHPNGAED
jgi:Class III cytochrome C family